MRALAQHTQLGTRTRWLITRAQVKCLNIRGLMRALGMVQSMRRQLRHMGEDLVLVPTFRPDPQGQVGWGAGGLGR